MILTTVTLQVKNVATKISPSDAANDVRDICSFFEAEVTRNGVRKTKNSRSRSFYNSETDSFPTGWIYYVRTKLQKLGYSVHTEDLRPISTLTLVPELNVNVPDGIVLRDYQQAAVDEILKRTRGIISICTGGGKTIVAAELIRRLKVPTFFIVPSTILLYQAYDVFCDWFGVRQVGLLGESKKILDKPVIVATQQTIWSSIKNIDSDVLQKMSEANAIMIDECHHIRADLDGANTWFQSLEYFDNAFYRIGLTGTPGKAGSIERRILEGATGRVSYEASAAELISSGYITPIHVIMVDTELGTTLARSDDRARNRLWHHNYKKSIVNNELRNKAIIKAASHFIENGMSCYISVNLVETHGLNLYSELRQVYGAKVQFLHGKIKTNTRQRVLRDFKSKEVLCVVGTILGEGVDIPSLDAVIMAGGGKSEYLSLQRIGRILRKSGGKTTAYVVDFTDRDHSYNRDTGKTNSVGPFRRHSIERQILYHNEGHRVWFSESGDITDIVELTEIPLQPMSYEVMAKE